jgi:S-phase kinase-associated protein 1
MLFTTFLCVAVTKATTGPYAGDISIAQAPYPTDALSPSAAARLADSKPSFTAYGDEPETCKLVSSDGEEFEIKCEYAMQSKLVANMIEDQGGDESVPLPNVKSAILKKVIDYLNHHGENPGAEEIQKPLKSKNLVECGVSQWDADFVADTNLTQEQLFEVILAANFMDIKSLLDLTCAKVASMIKGKNTEEIRAQFNIVNDFTPEEEAQVREENRWCEDA